MADIQLQTQQLQGDMSVMRNMLDDVTSQMNRMMELMGKTRDYTRSEAVELEEFRSLVVSIAEEFDKTYKGMMSPNASPFSKMLVSLEQQIEPIQSAIEAYNKNIESLTKEIERGDEERKTKRKEIMAGEEESSRLETLISGRMNKETKTELGQILGTGQDVGAKELRKSAKERIQLRTQEAKQGEDIIAKLRAQESANNKLIVSAQQSKKLEEDRLDSMKKQLVTMEKLTGLAKKRWEEEKERSRTRAVRERQPGLLTGALDMASQMNLPLVSQAATVARYGKKGVEAGAEIGPEGGVGGFLSKLIGGLGGLATAGGVLAGGYTAMQGYKTYNMAKQVAPMRVGLAPMMRGRDITGMATEESLMQMGFSPLENMQFMRQMGRTLGGKKITGENISQLSQLERQTGIGREELLTQAGMLQAVGGTAPTRGQPGKEPGRALKDIMAEGVKAGVDSAKLTEFTNLTLGIQEELLKITGENNAENIAKAMGSFIEAGTRRGRSAETFARGTEMKAIQTIDQAMKAAGRGQLPPQAMGTFARAFGFGAGGQKGSYGDAYYEFSKRMEKGLFAGTAEDQVKNLRSITEAYVGEAGGEKPAALRMQQEMGMGLQQFEDLRKLLKEITPGAKPTAEQEKRLKEFSDAFKDPSQKLLEVQARQEKLLVEAATKHLPEVIKIENLMLKAQEQAVKLLGSLVDVFRGEGSAKDILTNPVGAAVAAGAGAVTAYAAKKVVDKFRKPAADKGGTAPKTSAEAAKTPPKQGMLDPKTGKPLPKTEPGAQILDPSTGKPFESGKAPKVAPGASKALKIAKVGGKFLGATGLAVTAYEAYQIYHDPDRSPEDKKLAYQVLAAETGAGWAGATAGATTAAGIAGLFSGPLAPVTVPLAGIAGGIVGYYGGSKVGGWGMEKFQEKMGWKETQTPLAPEYTGPGQTAEPIPTTSPVPTPAASPVPPSASQPVAPRPKEHEPAVTQVPRPSTTKEEGGDGSLGKLTNGVMTLFAAVKANANALESNTRALTSRTYGASDGRIG